MSNNEQIQRRYGDLHAEALALLATIRVLIEDAPAPDENTQWGDVADMARYVESLRNVVGE